MKRHNAYLALGIVMAPFAVISIAWLFSSDGLFGTHGSFSDPRWTLTPVFGGLTVLGFWRWWKYGRRDRELRSVSAILQTYDMVPIAELASRLGKSLTEAESMVVAAVGDGYARGYVDRATDTFRREGAVSGSGMLRTEVVTRERVLVRCRSCGRLVEQGETRCTECGATLG